MKANSFGAGNNILDNSFTIQSSPQLLALLRLPGFEVMTCSGKQPTVEALIICISPPVVIEDKGILHVCNLIFMHQGQTKQTKIYSFSVRQDFQCGQIYPFLISESDKTNGTDCNLLSS